jgi:hypothetical protein
MNGNQGKGHAARLAGAAAEARWIEIDLSDLDLPADLATLDQLALAAAHVYERFVTYADEGWEWVTFPGSRDFDGWVVSEPLPGRRRVISGARVLSRRVAPEEPVASGRPSHGVSAYRTRQLTGRPWTAEPGAKVWKPFSRARSSGQMFGLHPPSASLTHQ